MTALPRRRTRLIAATVGIGLGTLLLSACQGTPGAAATVGDTVITEQQLASDVAELTSDPNAGATEASSTMVSSLLSRLVTVALIDQLAAQHGVAVTDGEIAAQLAAYQQQAGSKDAVYQVFAQQGIPASQVGAMVRLSVLATKLGPVLKPEGTADEQTQAIVEALAALSDQEDVTVNPRWGTWDASTLNLGPAPDDLSSLPSGT